MRQGGFADSRDVFEEQMSARHKADDGHLNDLSLALNDSRNIVLNRVKRFREVHGRLLALAAGEYVVD
jgi:hypothetical protein